MVPLLFWKGVLMKLMIKMIFKKLWLNIKLCWYKCLIVIFKQRKSFLTELINDIKHKIEKLEKGE